MEYIQSPTTINYGYGAIGNSKLSPLRMPFQSIPIVSLDRWFNGNEEEQSALARSVNAICRNIGFMYIKDHGIDEQPIAAIFRAAEVFFAMTPQDKETLHFKHSGFHRGYVPWGAESTDPGARADMKESFDCGLVVPVDQVKYPGSAARAMAPNLWPKELMGFRGVVEAYMEAVADLARTIFRIWACGFGLPLNYFDRMMDAPIAQLRLIHYPPTIDPTDKNFLGIGSHCDYEALTILCQDDVGGLQVMNHNREWIEATPIPGTFVVNIGEMMARWTNDIFCATPHRVINRSQRDRYSIPFFFGPNYDAEIACLSPCVQGVQAQYTPVIAGEYLSGRLKEIYGT